VRWRQASSWRRCSCSRLARPPKDAEIIDFGAGTGRGALMLALFGGLRVKMVDFAENCLDEDVRKACVSQPTRISFKQHDLTRPLADVAPYGYCCDVMEHIPPADVPTVLSNILASAEHVFFNISTVDDVMGATIGETLHLSVHPTEWWVEQIKDAGAVVHSAKTLDGSCVIYCSRWHEARDVVSEGVLNTAEDVIEAQTAANIRAGWTQAIPFTTQDREVVLLAGGPSMKAELETIRMLRNDGAALVTVNGAYGWAIEHGLQPSAQIVLDAREFNARFVDPPHPDCRYLIASQVHPATLAKLPKERTYLWHSGISDANEALLAELGLPYFPVPGGSTVVLRAFPLLRMLGYAKFHVFGFDSCVQHDGTHHAYPQPENDGADVIPVTCGARIFHCVPWQLAQASEFRDLVGLMADQVEMKVYGNGLIAHMIQTGADFAASDPAAAEPRTSTARPAGL
jgi:hypothetical protein